ncbi:4-phosphopantoate--beta-alanine ligase, partial [Thioclava sp. BHET1]
MRAGVPVARALAGAEAAILAGGYERVEYLELRRAEGLSPLATLDAPARLLAAAWIEGVRLIDNIAVDPA